MKILFLRLPFLLSAVLKDRTPLPSQRSSTLDIPTPRPRQGQRTASELLMLLSLPPSPVCMHPPGCDVHYLTSLPTTPRDRPVIPAVQAEKLRQEEHACCIRALALSSQATSPVPIGLAAVSQWEALAEEGRAGRREKPGISPCLLCCVVCPAGQPAHPPSAE